MDSRVSSFLIDEYSQRDSQHREGTNVWRKLDFARGSSRVLAWLAISSTLALVSRPGHLRKNASECDVTFEWYRTYIYKHSYMLKNNPILYRSIQCRMQFNAQLLLLLPETLFTQHQSTQLAVVMDIWH